MNNKLLLLPLFVIVALVQLYVPASMIRDREDVLKTGREFKFRTAPVDPNNPFMGKYIDLDFKEVEFVVANEKDWDFGESVYVSLTTDDDGYAKIQGVSKSKPETDADYVEAKIDFVSRNKKNKLSVNYDFNRLYMEESKAPAAEVVYIESQADTNSIAYALVKIKNGEAVLEDVMIDGVSIREIAKENRKREDEGFDSR